MFLYVLGKKGGGDGDRMLNRCREKSLGSTQAASRSKGNCPLFQLAETVFEDAYTDMRL